jgi:BirA family biotin operon repressor/biotin-[acetyl-CoA-carboxylase] ligase
MSANLSVDREAWVAGLISAVGPLLTTRRAGRTVRGLAGVDSTMSEAERWISAGAPDGALVVAATQSAGRGRMGRSWSDHAGSSLLCSVLLRAPVPPALVGLVPLAAGVACARAVAGVTGRRASLKWPNDVLIDGRKVAGLLVEGHAGADAAFVVGLGVNLGNAAVPDGMEDVAASLEVAARDGAPAHVLAAFLNSLEPLVEGIPADGGAEVLAAWESLMDSRGEDVTVSFPGTDRPPLSGVAMGLAGDGALRVDTPDGETLVYAGDVTLRAPAEVWLGGQR